MAIKPRVLVVEDEPDLRATMVSFLNLSGFVADGVGRNSEFEAWRQTHDCDLVLLDLGLPDGDGLSIARVLKAETNCGIVIVTARGELDERLEGYAVGADHYLLKPVDMREVVVVLRAVHGRMAPKEAVWLLDATGWRLTAPNGKDVRLTQSEVTVLKTLTQTPGELVPRGNLAVCLGFDAVDYDPRRMEIMIRRLRKKIIDETGLPVPIETVHGQGYAFAATVEFV
jgi:DNA-binding response OmpR family regulator